ncbi:MAG: amidohydrolase [Actinomycetota bacterium]|nr:amidohydrolase [Actinomycetota bacterium]
MFTANTSQPWADAIAVGGRRILGVGAEDELAARFPGCERLDLDGRTALPGLVDAHNHFLATGESLASIDVRFPGAASVDDVIARIASVATATPDGGAITAFGLNDAKYGRALTRWDLDRAGTRHPIRVLHVSGHGVVVNSLALKRSGIGDEVRDPPGGSFGRDYAGRLTGLCLDAAMQAVMPAAVGIGSHGPNFHTDIALDEAVDLVERAGTAFLEAGLTTVCDAQTTSRELTAYRAARDQGRLPVRTVCMPLSNQLYPFRELGIVGPLGDDDLSIGAMKIYADGSLIAGTAAFEESYGGLQQFQGSLYHSPADLADLIHEAHADGWQLGIHVQGDRAMTIVVDALEAAIRRSPREHRHRLEHAGYPTLALIERIAALELITVNQPNYLHDSGDEFLEHLGERAHGLQPLRSELDAGIAVVLSSDSDVTSYRPLDTMQASIVRQTHGGAAIGPSQALTLGEALRAHTIAAAFALRMEDRIGSLEPGKLADITVIDGDLEGTPVDDLSSLDIWMTMLGGRVRHALDPSVLDRMS